MTDTLRDRIADTLAHHPACNLKDEGYTAEDVLRMADAVIAHLDSRGWLIDPESGDRQRRASNKRWLEGNEDND